MEQIKRARMMIGECTLCECEGLRQKMKGGSVMKAGVWWLLGNQTYLRTFWQVNIP